MRWELGKPEHVFLYDKEGNLRRKFWLYPDGTVTYREWGRYGGFVTPGEKQLLGRLEPEGSEG